MPFASSRNHYIEKVQDHSHVLSDYSLLWSEFRDSYNVLDLGCGNGHFIQKYCATSDKSSHDSRENYRGLGVEKRFKRVFKSAEKIKDTQSRVIQGEILDFLLESPSFFWDEVWFQFPDPWPKVRHEKNRPVSTRSYREIARVLKSSGRFCFRSDAKHYWALLQGLNARYSLFRTMKLLQGDLFHAEPKTVFQELFLNRRIPIYSLELIK